MLPNEALNKVANLMNQIRPVGSGSYYLYVCNKQLALTQSRELPRYSIVITRLISSDINNGLSSNMWDRIDNQLRTLITKGLL